jgi:hypothetical protein
VPHQTLSQVWAFHCPRLAPTGHVFFDAVAV